MTVSDLMEIRPLLAERHRVATDLANVEKGMLELQMLVARRGITRDRAEAVITQCTEEEKRLAKRLADLDAALALLLGGALQSC
jgi:ABC-type uncharacterized transport system ATPase subunit